MNPIVHRPFSLLIRPTKFSSGIEEPHLFNVRLCYRPDGEVHTFYEVHIPPGLQPSVLSGNIKGILIETLSAGGIASELLPGKPKWLVLGVQMPEYTWVFDVPLVLRSARHRRILSGTMSCLLSVCVLTLTSFVWAGAVALVCGTHWLRTLGEIPTKPRETSMWNAD